MPIIAIPDFHAISIVLLNGFMASSSPFLSCAYSRFFEMMDSPHFGSLSLSSNETSVLNN